MSDAVPPTDPLPRALELLARTRDYLTSFAERIGEEGAQPDPEILAKELRRIASEAESLARDASTASTGYPADRPCEPPTSSEHSAS